MKGEIVTLPETLCDVKDKIAEILKGYRSETSVSDEMVALLPLFVQATRIENLVDAFEVEKSTGENYLDEEDVEEICQCILGERIYEK